MTTQWDKQQILQRHFGYTSFRKGQEVLVDALLSGRDVLAVMPTGSGKSLCYQVPAMLLPGLTLVISPLISLMKDQVAALGEAGIPAAYINSSLTPGQTAKAIQNVRDGRYRILYAAPERLGAGDFLSLFRDVPLSLVAVDEAHCVSQWGQDFRPSYLEIGAFIAALPSRPAVGAFTATATERVKEDIVSILGLRGPLNVATGFDRPNLRFEVLHTRRKQQALEDFLERNRGQSGIVYCLTRKNVEAVCEALMEAGHSATRYHAGLSDGERRQNQEDFQFDVKRVMVATNAFGMGIDKSNVRFVLHYNMPGSLEAYYQEAGRAGRDGAAAECVLLYSAQDLIMGHYLIDRDRENDAPDDEAIEAFRRQEHRRLMQMDAYCNDPRCLRQALLGYFGEESAPCGNCSVCDGEYEESDITTQALMILSCVSRMGGRFGAGLVGRVLRGEDKQRLRDLKLDRLSTYGIMKDVRREELQQMIAYLAATGYLHKTQERYPLLILGPKAREALVGGERVIWRRRIDAPAAWEAQRLSGKAPAQGGIPGGPLMEALRQMRTQIARRERRPPYMVFTDATLQDMCRLRPQTARELLKVSGVGELKLKRYGQAFLSVLRAESPPPLSAPAGHGVDEGQDAPHAKEAKPPKAGEPWNDQEDGRLRQAVSLGFAPQAIAIVHGRTEKAILARIKELELEGPGE